MENTIWCWLLARSLVASRGDCNGLQYCEREDFAKDVVRALMGRRLALFGATGRCAFTHIIQLLESWATQRAFLLPHQEGAGGSHEGSVVQALCLTFWQRKMNLDQAVVSLLIEETCGGTVAQKSWDWDSDDESWSDPTLASTLCKSGVVFQIVVSRCNLLRIGC